jgi:protein-S-isoprenylcysteine O-methyltransferase Ste14
MRRTLDELFLKVWLAIPPWLIGVVAGVLMLGYAASRFEDYTNFWALGHRVQLSTGEVVRVPFGRVLIDLTFLLMGISYLTRLPALRRATNVKHILIAGFGGVLPMLPFFFDGAFRTLAPEVRASVQPYLMARELPAWRMAAGFVCVLAGNALDVWAYVYLRRAFSVVPEARELVTGGPYRVVRHPVYAGQLLAQAGIWLCYAVMHGGWVAFYLVFFATQLYRSRAEEAVLEDAFGEDYRAFKARTLWFWRGR